MDSLITIVRFPIGLIAWVLALILFFILFPLESVAAIIIFPFAATFLSRM